jgi:hypothetical protein
MMRENAKTLATTWYFTWYINLIIVFFLEGVKNENVISHNNDRLKEEPIEMELSPIHIIDDSSSDEDKNDADYDYNSK